MSSMMHVAQPAHGTHGEEKDERGRGYRRDEWCASLRVHFRQDRRELALPAEAVEDPRGEDDLNDDAIECGDDSDGAGESPVRRSKTSASGALA